MKAFYTVTQIKSTLYNIDYQEILTYPVSGDHCSLCQAIRGAFVDRCKASDLRAFKTCTETEKIFEYLCHAGLYEVVFPIQDEHGIIGYIMFGQIYNTDHEELLQERLAEYGKDLGHHRLLNALSTLKPMNSKMISAVTLMMQTCITYLLTNRIVRVNKNNFEERLVQYIDDNIGTEISITDMCFYFGMSRTSFYELSEQCLGSSIMKYIKRLRIEKAKKLLQDSDLSIAQISEQVGFQDYNYFMRVFKKETGVSCKEFRQIVS